MDQPRNDAPRPEERPVYDPPKVERVVDADELAREVHYAGARRISEVV